VRADPKSEVLDLPAMRMREATVAAAVPLTFGVGLLGCLYVALTWSQPHRLFLLMLFVVSSLGSLGVYSVRQQMVRSPHRELLFLAWTLSDFALIISGTVVDGGTSCPLVIVLFLPVVFSAMSYPVSSVVIVSATSVLTYLGLALSEGGTNLAYTVSFAFILLCTGLLSSWQAQNQNRQHRALAKASRTDPLTGCLNRRGFEERANAELAAMRRCERGGAIVVLDVDKFKPVNDIFGHAAGDELLCWVVATLQGTVRQSDAIGRLGGDEFALVLPEIGADAARDLTTRIGEALAERAPCSLGVALYPHDGDDLETLTRRADSRLYGSRRGRYEREQASETATPLESVAPEGEQERAGFGAIDLWRAALDAMPSRAGRGERERPEESVQSMLLDQIDASVIVTDMTGVVISWNHGAEALYGWRHEEAVGRSARELVVPEDAAQAELLMMELSRDGRWDGELLVRDKDGNLFTTYVRNRLVLDEGGLPSAVVGVAVDVSARVAAETELRDSRNYAQAVTECMGEGLFTLDPDGRITYINRVAEEMLGRGRGELMGCQVGAMVYAPRADTGPIEFEHCAVARAARGGETVRVEDGAFATGDGGELPVAYTATPFSTEDGPQGCVVIFQDISERKRREEESRRNAETLAVIERVERALVNESFVLHSQPIIDLGTGATIQHELLIRMVEADGHVVAPGDFLPVCEQYSMIGEIDWWVIKQAARLAGEGHPVQANISARSVGDPDVLEHIERCIEQHEVAPGTLVFEITETAVVEDETAARTFAERLRRLGCKIALDDFGTGYASLTYLKQMPVDFLKLDIEFVRDLSVNEASRHVVQALVALARDFELRTVGEGVEDAATLALLGELGVDYAQGFHIARPAPFGEGPADRLAAPEQPAERSVPVPVRSVQPRGRARRAARATRV
jgi:diguanylate cyclase (GGDEF)-like protein/PAS domain S-box-containing protein